LDDLEFDEPDVSTSIEYTIISLDVTSASSAARATNDPSILVEGLSTALPADRLPEGETLKLDVGYATGQAAPPPRPASSATLDSGSTIGADETGTGWVIVLVLFLFVLGGIGAAGFFFWRESQKYIPKASINKESFSNPMLVRSQRFVLFLRCLSSPIARVSY
jgi:hypothetical protein